MLLLIDVNHVSNIMPVKVFYYAINKF